VVALSSSIAGGVLASAGTYVVYLQQRRNRKREQAVETVAAALTALREIDPDAYAERLPIDERGRELISDKRGRWLQGRLGGSRSWRQCNPTLRSQRSRNR
jgi:hypothetical protein